MEKKLIIILLFFVNESWAQNKKASVYTQGPRRKLTEEKKPLTLAAAIEEGLRKNYGQQMRHLQTTILDNNWRDTRDSFYLPEIKLTLQTRTQRIGGLRSGRNSAGRVPDGTLGLELADYTLFNWGKDSLAFLNEKKSYHRDTEKLREKKRSLRHRIIESFFRLVKDQRIFKIKKEQLRHASFVYRLTHEKILTQKVNKQSYFQTRTEYLRSQTEYQEARNQMQNTNEDMVILLSDDPGVAYSIHQIMEFAPIEFSMENSVILAKKLSPGIRDAKVKMENAKREHIIVQKDNLPLPKISLTLGAYKHNFNSQTSQTLFENEMGGSSVEMAAVINASWAITGEGGLFNARKTNTSLTGLAISQKQLDQTQHYIKL
ncbi:MAG: TolC family protein, partial [Halobacteriovoraceae bacterium]|nr:TolC family protein [Halobacteriovoraceae bacterium]